MKLRKNWREIKARIRIQKDNGIPRECSLSVTVGEFIDKHQTVFRTGTTTICEPPLIDFIVDLDESTRHWLSIPFDKLFEDY